MLQTEINSTREEAKVGENGVVGEQSTPLYQLSKNPYQMDLNYSGPK